MGNENPDKVKDWRETHSYWSELLRDESDKFDHAASYFMMGMTRNENKKQCPVDLGDYRLAYLKTIANELEDSVAKPGSEDFIGNLSHTCKHLFAMLQSSLEEHDNLLSNPVFLDYLDSYKRAYEAIPSTYSFLERRSVSLLLGMKEEADKLMEDFRILRKKIQDEEVPERTYTDEDLENARKILSEFIERFKNTPEYNFDLKAYLADQKRQWSALKSE